MKLRSPPKRVMQASVIVVAAGFLLGGGRGLGGEVTADTACPVPSITKLEQRETRAMGLAMDPPGPVQPLLSGEDAARRACEEMGGGNGASGVIAVFGIWSTDQFGTGPGRPMWLVTYRGVCVPVHGSPEFPGQAGMCVGSELHVLIDATTGKFIGGFAQGLPTPESEVVGS